MKIKALVGASALVSSNLVSAVTVTDGLDMDITSTVAASSTSIAAGAGNTVSASSFAMGSGNTATNLSLAIGGSLYANNYSLVYGDTNNSSGTSSGSNLVGGSGVWVTDSYYSVGLGFYNVLETQQYSVSLGVANELLGGGSANIVLGNTNTVTATNNNVVLGGENVSTAASAWILGAGNIGQSETVTLGKYAATVSDAALIVGTGTSSGSRSNGLVVLKNGDATLPGTLTLGGSPAVTSGYLSTNKYLTASYGSGASAAATAIAAFGTGATATHADSFAVGNSADATNTGAIAIGSNSSATAIDAVSIGYATYARAQRSFAASTGGVNASGYGGSALSGGLSEAVHAVALGQGTAARAFSSVSVGSHPITEWGDNASTWVATDSVFTVGNGTTYGGPNQSNALKILKNGKSTFKNKKWTSGLGDPDAGDGSDAAGVALRVEGHTELQGKVTIAIPQGDISMGDFE